MAKANECHLSIPSEKHWNFQTGLSDPYSLWFLFVLQTNGGFQVKLQNKNEVYL